MFPDAGSTPAASTSLGSEKHLFFRTSPCAERPQLQLHIMFLELIRFF
jgi:hypothetical protein